MIDKYNPLDLSSIEAKPILDKDGKPDRNFQSGDTCIHFKGHLIQFLGFGKHTETEEEIAVYRDVLSENPMIWTRPKEMFLSEVDAVKYPEYTQKYRIERVYLEKKITKHGFSTVKLTSNTELDTTIRVREFFKDYKPNGHERVQVWTVPFEKCSDLSAEQRPLKDPKLVQYFTRNVNLEHDRSASNAWNRYIKFSIGNAHVTILYGDLVHFINDNRMVIENTSTHSYEFFEIVPYLERGV